MHSGDPPTGITRRTWMLGSIAIAGGIVFGYYRYHQPGTNPLQRRPHLDSGGQRDGITSITPYLIINTTGVTIIAPRAEMGHGVQATLAAFVAEESVVALTSPEIVGTGSTVNAVCACIALQAITIPLRSD